ncbi:hypothetical protein SD70_25950 [Gordoniibacillus kamchatkensis]|uniref:Uncharacterized protein n=1 Tax=Gordoniibacillus kamchatkensis TaxID=1590651 RepID=A0ABR5ABQ4_9BACL|nr:hypothetical protein [Paenibacillus sp. VKM B-2647]KIL38489.1 hypothetical protein SD70_25950 [Paenibacillus sp. VKM B-2647]
MNFNIKLSIIATIVVIAGLVLLYQRRDEEERHLAWKLLGCYVLGSFVFNVMNVPVPLGIGVYLVFFRPRSNAAVKRYAAFFGLLVAIVGHLFPV